MTHDQGTEVKLGSIALRTVGSTTFLEDSNGIVKVDIKWMGGVGMTKVDPFEVATFIAAACNAYNGDRCVKR